MRRKSIRSSRYLAAFALTIVIFLIGYILGVMISEAKLQRVYDLENDIRIESLGNELLMQIINRDACATVNTTTYTTDLATMGRRLTYMEGIYGYDAPQVTQLKNYYTLLLIRHWLFSEQLREECDIDMPSVLYFYTNIGECGDCEGQGIVLTAVHKDYSVFNTYSFEYYQENPALNYLKERYGITPGRLPTLVIDGEVHYGFQSEDFLIERLDLERRLAADTAAHPERY